MAKWEPPDCECPAEWKHAEHHWREGYHRAHREAWEAGYRKGEKVKKALKKYASGGRVELLERAIRKARNG
jgi:hypothetical protein